jgi:integrase
MNTQNQITWSELQNQAMNRLWKATKSEPTASVNTYSAVEFFGPDVIVSDLNVQQIDKYVDSLQAKGNSNATINRKLSALSKMLKFALDRDWITKLPKISKRKESNGRIRWLTPQEEHKLVQHYNETNRPDLATFVMFLLDTGARVGEALAVKWKDFSNGSVTFWDTKNNSPRSVPITARVRSILNLDNLSPSEGGPFEKVSYNEFIYIWHKTKKALGYGEDDQFVPHCLRHTCASRLAQAGVPLITIKEFMGHKTIQITLRYAHLAPNQLDKAKEVLESIWVQR